MMNKKNKSKKVMVGAITATMIMQLVPINVFAESDNIDNNSLKAEETQATKEKNSNDQTMNNSKGKDTNKEDAENKNSGEELNKANIDNKDVKKDTDEKKENQDLDTSHNTLKDNLISTDKTPKSSNLNDKENKKPDNSESKKDIDAKVNASDIINIPDINLKKALNKALKQAEDSNITKQQLESLKTLDIENSGVQNLEGLQYCKNINWLNLNGNKISDISPLKGITSVTNLYLDNNNISDLTPLSGLTKLQVLGAAYNEISNVAPLSGLINLNWLNLDYNKISDINSLKTLTNLISLNLNKNDITDISVIDKLPNLAVINLYSNPLSSLEPLRGLTNLNVVGLRDTGISNISIIATLTNLTSLDLAYNNISNIEELRGLTKLKYLYLDVNKISNVTPLSNLKNLEHLSLNNNNIADVSSLKDLTKLNVLHMHNQIINLKEIISHGTAEVNNVIKDENGNAIAPYSISNGGTYDSNTGKVIWDNINQNVNEIYTFNKTVKIGNANGDFIGTVNQPIIYVSDAKPVIDGANDVSIKDGSHFDPLQGVTATDKEDGNLTKDIKVTGEVNTNKPGKYKLTYSVTDKDGNTVTVVRTVTVEPKQVESAPVINAENKVIKVGETFDPMSGVTATDKRYGDITKDIKIVENNVNTNKVGTYKVTYKVTNKDGETTEKTITVEVIKTLNPIIHGANDIEVPKDKPFNPMSGITATDRNGNDITKDVNVFGNVNVNKPDSYKLTYSVTDKDGNSTTVERIIKVISPSTPKTGDVGMIGYLGVGLSALGAMILGKKKMKK